MGSGLDFGAASDTGCVRENNEDSYRVAPELNLFVLSDGMGGLAAGEVASRVAVDTVVGHCREAETNPALPFLGEKTEGVSETSNRLASAARLANQAVQEAAKKAGAAQMGATLEAVRFIGERMSLVHVGDSRIYRLRGTAIEMLTRDHSFVAEQVRAGQMTAEEAETSPMRSVLMRGLGIDPEVEVDVSEELVMVGDTILLCSDGLTRELSDAQIAGTLADSGSAKKAANRLVSLAKEAGGGDNITAIVVRPVRETANPFARIGRWFRNSG